jgi:hypothetical protein
MLQCDLSPTAEMALITGARDARPVGGLTHNFYRYPARFSPLFVRAAISAFTAPGDYVLDPYVGGGTSLVEAMALGRHAVGVDISQLAEFIASVKTAVLTDRELQTLSSWAARLPQTINMNSWSPVFTEYAESGYYKNMNTRSRWRLRKALEQSLNSAIMLGSGRANAFARCVILKTAQWALDGRKRLPPISEFRKMIAANAHEMIAAAQEFRATVEAHGDRPVVNVINRSATGLDSDARMISLPVPRLIVTSPPYPGIHVLYHRWQVDGRKETPLPFMIANKLDGSGSSYYTMGDRHNKDLGTYFAHIEATMSSVVALANSRTTFVQMVAFSDSAWQLPRYLETMERLGLTELFLPSLQREEDGRLWRAVPNRRWYSDQRGETPGSQEVVLIHRLRHKPQALSSRPSTLSTSLKSMPPSDVSASMNGARARHVESTRSSTDG